MSEFIDYLWITSVFTLGPEWIKVFWRFWDNSNGGIWNKFLLPSISIFTRTSEWTKGRRESTNHYIPLILNFSLQFCKSKHRWSERRQKGSQNRLGVQKINKPQLITASSKEMQPLCSSLVFCLRLQKTTGICLHEPQSETRYKCFNLIPGTILKLLPVGLLLGSVEMGYPLNSTCSDIDTELCVCVCVCVCACDY